MSVESGVSKVCENCKHYLKWNRICGACNFLSRQSLPFWAGCFQEVGAEEGEDCDVWSKKKEIL
jgi:hypothetical protein